MEKPTLQQFDLTEKEYAEYFAQEEKYKEKCNSVDATNFERAQLRDRRHTQACWIGVGALFLTMIIIGLSTGFELSSTEMYILCILAFFGCPTLVGVAYYKITTSNYPNLQHPYRAGYIDPKLDQKMQKYIQATKDYEEYSKRISKAFWEGLSAYQFEKEVAKLFEKEGYEAQVTPGSGDGGVDIVLTKNYEKFAVQCKHHSYPVGPNDIRALFGVVKGNNFSGGIFVSLNGYTDGAIEEGKRYGLTLIQLSNLLQMAKK